MAQRQPSMQQTDFWSQELTATSPNGRCKVSILPGHGIISGWKVDDWDVLYRPHATKNVARCGIPVLVPNFGALKDNKFVDAGTTLLKHGFGRIMPWTPVETGKPNAVAYSISDTPETMQAYPFKFKFTVEAEVNDMNELLVRLRMDNHEAGKVLPVCPGFHPYFACHGARKIDCKISGIDTFNHDEWKWQTVEDTPDNTYTFTRQVEISIPSKNGKVIISELVASDEKKHLNNIQVWSAPMSCEDTDFICVEPIVAPPNGLNDKEKRLNIAPGQSLTIGTLYKVQKN